MKLPQMTIIIKIPELLVTYDNEYDDKIFELRLSSTNMKASIGNEGLKFKFEV
jgi:hypothetical protein